MNGPCTKAKVLARFIEVKVFERLLEGGSVCERLPRERKYWNVCGERGAALE